MTKQATRPEAPLRVGFVPGVTLRKWRTAWAERFPAVALRVVEVPEAGQRGALDAGEVDLCFVRLPVDADGLHVIRLYEEAAVAWLARDHPLAERDQVSDADLAALVVLREPDAGSIERVALGEAVLRVPQSIARTHSRRDLVHLPIAGAEATTIALAWRVEASHPWIDEFIGVVRGRTPNSSRTVQARDAAQGAAPARAPAASRPARPARRPGRLRGRRRTRG